MICRIIITCLFSSAWIELDNIKPYANFRESLKKNKGSGLKMAVEEIEKYVLDNPDALKIKVSPANSNRVTL